MSLTWGLVIQVILVFATITVVSAIAAQVNTMSDYELDLGDNRKKELVQAMSLLGKGKLKTSIVVEFLLSLALIILLFLILGKPASILMWMAAVFLAYAYSAPPLRLKSRAWLAMITLLLVLSILPISFVFHTVASGLDSFFLLFLAGQALTVYGVIVPAEIRDYFGDEATGIETLTVQLGLVKASFLGIVLLGAGGMLCGTAFFVKLAFGSHPILSVFLLVMAVAYCFVLGKYRTLYSLSSEYASSKNQSSIAQVITSLSARNPRWITLITQSIVFMSLVLLIGKFLT